MGSPSLMIILILVVWIIVLAPLMIGNNKPIRRSGEGYEETRVLHEGGTAPMAERRRPKLTAADIHRHSEDDDYEVVEATDTEDDVLIDDAPALHTFFRRPGASASAAPAELVEGEVIEHVDGEDADTAAETQAEADAAEVEASEETVGEATVGGSTKVVASQTGGSTSVKLIAAAGAAENDDADEAEAELGRYELDESYTAPEDYGYADSELGSEPVAEPAADLATEEVTDATADNSAVAETDGTEEGAAAENTEEVTSSDDASEEDIAFAASRRGRGGYDPERERKTTATRFQRRQRTLLALIAACVVTFVVAFVAGGWTWVLPAIAVGLTAWFMIALRQVVLQERALQERRLRQLRRARMGVATGAEEHPRDARLRAGSVVLELDDDSPDFDTLPSARFTLQDEGFSGFEGVGTYGTRAS